MDKALDELRNQREIRLAAKNGPKYLLPGDVKRALMSGALCNGAALLEQQYGKKILDHPKDCKRCGTTARNRLGWN